MGTSGGEGQIIDGKVHCTRLLQIAFFVVELVQGFHPGRYGKGLSVAGEPDDFFRKLLTMLPVEPVLKATLPSGATTSGDVLCIDF